MEYVQLICALVGVIALIFLFFWVLRKVNKGILTTGGKRLKILDRASLGGEKSVVVVSVAGKCMVLGVTAGKIEKIDDIELTEEEYLSELYPEGEKQDGFFAAFSDALTALPLPFRSLMKTLTTLRAKIPMRGTRSRNDKSICSFS